MTLTLASLLPLGLRAAGLRSPVLVWPGFSCFVSVLCHFGSNLDQPTCLTRVSPSLWPALISGCGASKEEPRASGRSGQMHQGATAASDPENPSAYWARTT